jgi:hypothetical protein
MVSITDVAASVPHNSDFDLRARRNDKKGAMLRPFEGKDLRDTEVGLTSNAERLSVTTTIPLDKNFDIAGDPRFKLTKIKLETGGELAHEEVSDILQDPYHEMFAMFRDAANAAVNLREKREKKGAIPSTKLPPERDWQRTEADSIQLTSFESTILPHMMVEEFMVLTNSAITSYLTEKGYPAIYKGRDLRDGEPQREEIIADLQDRKDELSQRRYKEEVEWIIHRQTESFYSPFPEINVVLNEAHTQNTSPMRKYDALINQRVLIAAIRGDPPPYDQKDLNRICRRFNASPELNHIHPGERIPMEIPKGVTNDQRIQRKLRAELKEKEYVGERFQELKIKTERRKAEGKKLVGDEKLMDEYLDVSERVSEKPTTKVVYRKVKNVGPRGERISVNGKERNGNSPKPKEVFPNNPESGPCIVAIHKLNDFDGKKVTVEALIEQGLVDERARADGVKIHAVGNLNMGKSLDIVGIAITDNAVAKIIARKGTVQEVPPTERDLRRKKREIMARDARAMTLIEEREKNPRIFPFSQILRKEKSAGLYPHGDISGPSQIPVDVNLLGRWYGPSELPFWEAMINEKSVGIYPHGDVPGPSQIREELMKDYYVKRDIFLANAGVEKVKIPLPKKDRIFPSKKRERRVVSSIQSIEKENGIYQERAQYEVTAYGPSELGFWDLFNKEKRRGIKPGGTQSEISRKMMDNYYAPRVDPEGPWQAWGGFLKYHNSTPPGLI